MNFHHPDSAKPEYARKVLHNVLNLLIKDGEIKTRLKSAILDGQFTTIQKINALSPSAQRIHDKVTAQLVKEKKFGIAETFAASIDAMSTEGAEQLARDLVSLALQAAQD